MITPQLKESGLLEAYLLGVLTNQEQVEVAALLASDADLTTHLHNLDADLTAHFGQQSVPPPPAIRGIIELRNAEQQLQKRGRRDQSGSAQDTDYRAPTTHPNYVDVEVDNTHLRVHKYWRTAFIAVVILSKIFLIMGLYFYFKADSQAQEISRLKAEISHTVQK